MPSLGHNNFDICPELCFLVVVSFVFIELMLLISLFLWFDSQTLGYRTSFSEVIVKDIDELRQ